MIEVECRGCGKVEDIDYPKKYHRWIRYDAYGIYTGVYCDNCYEHNYPFRKDEYFDAGYAGERLDEDD